MNRTTKDIMNWLQVDKIEAMKLQEMIAEAGIDFSRVSNNDLKNAAKAAHRKLHGTV